MSSSRRRRLVWLLVVQILGGSFAIGPLVTGAAGASGKPLPACRYDDVLTARHSYDAWDKTVLDPIYMVPRGYVPNDLVNVSSAGLSGGGKIRRVAQDALREMTAAAKSAGKPIGAASAYRSYSTQSSIFRSNVRRSGFTAAALVSARPGHSEHQLATTIDFKSNGGRAPWYVGDWAQVPAGRWMKENAWKFGWVMSYPKGRTNRTCYRYEPWHYRYVGRDSARAIHESGLSLREWLWAQGYGE